MKFLSRHREAISMKYRLREKKPCKEPMRYVPTLPLEERDARWAKIRAEMANRGIDCLVIWSSDRGYGTAHANMRYLLGIAPESIAGGIGLFPVEGDPVAFVDYPNYYDPYPAHIAYQDWISDIRPLAGMRPIAEEIKKRGYSGGTIGLVSHYLACMIEQEPYIVPHYDLLALQRLLPKARIVESTDIVDRARMIKSRVEIEMLEASGRIARRMVDAMIETAKPGVRENEVFAKMTYVMLTEGGEGYLFNQLASGSIDDEWRHLLHGKGLPLGPTARPLGDNDIIITEFHASYGGYLTGVEFTALVGRENGDVRYIHDIAVESFKEAIPRFTPGTKLQEVIDAMRKPVLEAGLRYIELGFHGHGLSSPDFPTYVYSSDWPYEAGEGIRSMRLQENMVFGINIDIHNPRWRDDIGVMLGDTVVVSDAPKLLANIPLELPVCR